MNDFSHWGFCDVDDDGECYCVPSLPTELQHDSPSVILTSSGELLVQSRVVSPAHCVVAIVIGRNHGALSDEQIQNILRAWDVAVELVNGSSDNVTLLPVPQTWEYVASNYYPAAMECANICPSSKRA